MSALVLFSVLLVFLSLIGLVASFLLRAPGSGRRLRAATLRELQMLSPKGFEQAIATLLEDLGYNNTRVVGGAGDLARDVAAISPEGTPVTVQCKHYSNAVGSPQVQLFIGMLQTQYRGSRGIYATTSRYTPPALALGRRFGVTMWDGPSLAKLIVEAKMRREEAARVVTKEQLFARALAKWQASTKSMLAALTFAAILPSVISIPNGGGQGLIFEWFWGDSLIQPCCQSISFLDFGPVGKTETIIFVGAMAISVATYLRKPDKSLLGVLLALYVLLFGAALYVIGFHYQSDGIYYLPLEEFALYVAGIYTIRTFRLTDWDALDRLKLSLGNGA